MRFHEFIKKKKLRTFTAKVKLPQLGGSSIIVDTTVMARNQQMARQLLRKQYGGSRVIVGQPRELK